MTMVKYAWIRVIVVWTNFVLFYEFELQNLISYGQKYAVYKKTLKNAAPSKCKVEQ